MVNLNSGTAKAKASKTHTASWWSRELAKRIVYSFHFVGGGGNTVWAYSKQEAIAKAHAEFPQFPIDDNSFTPRYS